MSLTGSRIAVYRMLNISPLVVGVYGICLFTLAISLFLGAPRNWLEFSLLFPLLVVSAIPIVALPDRRLMARLLRSFEFWLLVFSVVSLCVGFATQDVAELAVKCQNRALLFLISVIGFVTAAIARLIYQFGIVPKFLVVIFIFCPSDAFDLFRRAR